MFRQYVLWGCSLLPKSWSFFTRDFVAIDRNDKGGKRKSSWSAFPSFSSKMDEHFSFLTLSKSAVAWFVGIFKLVQDTPRVKIRTLTKNWAWCPSGLFLPNSHHHHEEPLVIFKWETVPSSFFKRDLSSYFLCYQEIPLVTAVVLYLCMSFSLSLPPPPPFYTRILWIPCSLISFKQREGTGRRGWWVWWKWWWRKNISFILSLIHSFLFQTDRQKCTVFLFICFEQNGLRDTKHDEESLFCLIHRALVLFCQENWFFFHTHPHFRFSLSLALLSSSRTCSLFCFTVLCQNRSKGRQTLHDRKDTFPLDFILFLPSIYRFPPSVSNWIFSSNAFSSSFSSLSIFS